MKAPTISAPRPFGVPATIEGFLDRLKQKHGSDYAAAKAMGIRQQALSNYRNGRTLPDNIMAIRIADEIGLPRDYVLASVEAERAAKTKDPTVVMVWRDMAEKLGVICLVVTGALLVTEPLFLESSLIYAFLAAIPFDVSTHYTHWSLFGLSVLLLVINMIPFAVPKQDQG